MRFTRSFFSQSVLTLSLVSILFFTTAMALLLYYLILPLGEQSAKSLAALLHLTAQEWQQSQTPAQRQALEERLRHFYALELRTEPPSERPTEPFDPLHHWPAPSLLLLQQALRHYWYQPIPIWCSPQQQRFWIVLPGTLTQPEPLWIALSADRYTLQLPPLLGVMLLLGIAAMILTALRMGYRLTQPLQQLAEAARRIGRGESAEPLQIEGPQELHELVTQVNQMGSQIQDLLTNRTTLLAGISHDLRSPITRIELALAMLPPEVDQQLRHSLHNDIQQMDQMIGMFLEVSRGLEPSSQYELDVVALLNEVVQSYPPTTPLQWSGARSVKARLHPLALRRMITNLIDNALRYSQFQPVEIRCYSDAQTILIEIADRGPGIEPRYLEAVFRPFFRLERSRSRQTGGSGLGLTITRQLAHANGCQVSLRPRSGGGLTATLQLHRYNAH